MGFSGKESFCKAGDTGSIPGSRRSPEEGNGSTLQYSCLGNHMDRGAWWGTAHGVQHKRVGHDLVAENKARNHLYRTVILGLCLPLANIFFFFFPHLSFPTYVHDFLL